MRNYVRDRIGRFSTIAGTAIKNQLQNPDNRVEAAGVAGWTLGGAVGGAPGAIAGGIAAKAIARRLTKQKQKVGKESAAMSGSTIGKTIGAATGIPGAGAVGSLLGTMAGKGITHTQEVIHTEVSRLAADEHFKAASLIKKSKMATKAIVSGLKSASKKHRREVKEDAAYHLVNNLAPHIGVPDAINGIVSPHIAGLVHKIKLGRKK